MKKHVLWIFALVICMTLSLISCKKATPVYSDRVSAAELAEEVEDELDLTDFRDANGDWLSDYVTLPEGLADYKICYSSEGNNLNEFGIWHVRSDQIAPMEATLRTYLAESLLRNRTFYDSYIPEETPKLEHAEVRVFGNYVCYAILNESDRGVFFRTIEEELTES